MIDVIFFSLFAIVGFILQMQMTTIPFVVGISIVLFILYRSPRVFLLVFVAGLFLDVAHLMPLGMTSLFLVTFLFLVSLYERKFEIRTYYFVFFSTLICSVVFLLSQKQSYVIQSGFITAAFSVLWYRIGLRV